MLNRINNLARRIVLRCPSYGEYDRWHLFSFVGRAYAKSPSDPTAGQTYCLYLYKPGDTACIMGARVEVDTFAVNTNETIAVALDMMRREWDIEKKPPACPPGPVWNEWMWNLSPAAAERLCEPSSALESAIVEEPELVL